MTGQSADGANSGPMTPEPDPTTSPPLFKQRNRTQLSWHLLGGGAWTSFRAGGAA
jgi:hypothetical protein